MKILVQEKDFDIGAEIKELRARAQNVGAIVSFTGLVREIHQHNERVADIKELFLEHYPGMTEKALADIAEQAGSRWALLGSTIIHRVGTLHPADQIVLVLTASEHRGEAFAAAEFIMDYLKTRAPFWKREAGNGSRHWVSYRQTDIERAERWQEKGPTD